MYDTSHSEIINMSKWAAKKWGEAKSKDGSKICMLWFGNNIFGKCTCGFIKEAEYKTSFDVVGAIIEWF